MSDPVKKVFEIPDEDAQDIYGADIPFLVVEETTGTEG